MTRTTSRPAPSGSASPVPGQVVLCLGCVQGVLDLPHQCAGDRELAPYGGRCQCTRPGCGPRRRKV